MITKDTARLIFNCYHEIEQAEKMIVELQKSINEKGEFDIKDNWGDKRGLELHIPTSSNGHSIKKVPIELALNVIKSHIETQNKELTRLKEVALIQLA